MPTYKVKSGDLKVEITTLFQAEAEALCIMALERKKRIKALGSLMGVKGGHLTYEVFLSTESVLQKMGMMEGKK